MTISQFQEKELDDSATLTEAGLYEEAILTMQVLFFLILGDQIGDDVDDGGDDSVGIVDEDSQCVVCFDFRWRRTPTSWPPSLGCSLGSWSWLDSTCSRNKMLSPPQLAHGSRIITLVHL